MESSEERNTPKGSPTSPGARCYHSNSPAFFLPPVAKYLRSSEEQERSPFSANA